MVYGVHQVFTRPLIERHATLKIAFVASSLIQFQCQHAARSVRACVFAALLLLTPVYAVAQFAVRTRLYEAPHLLGTLQIFAIFGRQVEVSHVYAHPDIVVVEAVALRRVVDIRGISSRFAAVVIVSIQSAHHGLVHELEPFLVATCLV